MDSCVVSAQSHVVDMICTHDRESPTPAAIMLEFGLIRVVVFIFTIVTMWVFLRSYTSFSRKTIRLPRWLGITPKDIQTPKSKCGLSKICPNNFFAFKISSGAANVVGPSMCFEDEIIMSPVRNNVGRGLNVALVNGSTGQVMKKDSFDMYSGDPQLLLNFLTEIPDSTLVLVASYDDPGTKMNDKIKTLFSNLGSSYAKQLGFRDSWVFVGAKDLKSKSPYEQPGAIGET